MAIITYSITLRSKYLIANLLRLLISNGLVLPVWFTSWHNPEITVEKWDKSFNSKLQVGWFTRKLQHCITETPW